MNCNFDRVHKIIHLALSFECCHLGRKNFTNQLPILTDEYFIQIYGVFMVNVKIIVSLKDIKVLLWR